MIHEYVAAMSWVTKAAIVSIGLVIFSFLITGLAARGIRPEVTLAWWLLGSAIGIFALAKGGGMAFPLADFYENWKATLAVLALGIVLGTIINVGFGQAIAEAPNPGLASAVLKAEITLSYLIAPLLFAKFPSHFPVAEVNMVGVIGVVITTIGIVIVTYSRNA